MPDCDVFSSAGRSGRAAGAALLASIGGGAGGEGGAAGEEEAPDLWEHLVRHLNGALGATRGLGLLPRLLRALEQYGSEHLQLPFLLDQSTEGRLGELERLEREHGHSVLDLRLGRVARREVARECLDACQIVREFIVEYCSGTIIFGRGGLIETKSAAWVRDHLGAMRKRFEPFARAAAEALLLRPDAVRLRLNAPAGCATFDPMTTNLLGE